MRDFEKICNEKLKSIIVRFESLIESETNEDALKIHKEILIELKRESARRS